LNLADYNPDSYRGIIQEAGITITPCSRDRWFPATSANSSSPHQISERTGQRAPTLGHLITYPEGHGI